MLFITSFRGGEQTGDSEHRCRSELDQASYSAQLALHVEQVSEPQFSLLSIGDNLTSSLDCCDK